MSKFNRSLFTCALAAFFLACSASAFADAVVRTLPQPDTSKLSPTVAKQISEARAAFEKDRINLVGDQLAQAYAKIGAIYARAGINDVASIAMYDASQLAPKNPAWLYLRGVLASAQKLNTDARADFQAALALDDVYLPIRYRLADTLIELGDLDAAHKVLADALPKHKDQAALLAMLGRLELKQKHYADAIAHLEQALTLEPKANALYKDLAAAYSAQGDAEKAKNAQARIGTTPPDLADPIVAKMYNSGPSLHGTALEQAQQLLAMSRFWQARAKVAEALLANDKDVSALALSARLDALLGRHDAAQKTASIALTLKPNDAAANLSQGMVYEFAGDDAKAFPFYQRAVQLDPIQVDAHLLLGNALMRRGQYAPAAEQYRHVAVLDPHSENVDARIAAALVAQGKCGDALKQVNAALSKRSHDGDLMQVFVRLASTCNAASEQERGMALDYAKALYKQRPDAGDSTALALAEAAQGKFDEAQKSQAEAIFEAVRTGDAQRAKMYRETMRQFAAKQMPHSPWPSDDILFKPPLLSPLPTRAQDKKQK